MSKIQGKQIAESTITQNLLSLGTPTSGDTTSGATVDYVNQHVSTSSGVIGLPEEGTTYVDGIFTDFTTGTTVGVAVDRFNEMFKLLAPTPPTTTWNIFGALTLGSTYSATAVGTTTPVVGNISPSQTPTYSLAITSIGTGANARALLDGTFVMSGVTSLETANMTTGSTTRTGGIINWTVADPYAGTQGSQGFWTGVTAMSVSGTAPSQPSAGTSYNLSFYHTLGTGSPNTNNYYVNTVGTTTISSISATFPTMTRYISGVPSIALGGGQSITSIGFTVNNAIGYFYTRSLWTIAGTASTTVSDQAPTTLPTVVGQTVVETGKSIVVSSSAINSESMTVTITAKNAAGTPGTAGTLTSNIYRIDGTSVETTGPMGRLTSGSGTYPTTGWGGTFNSTQVLLDSNVPYNNELMMLNNTYKYPSGNYSTYVDATNGAGPNYNTGVSGVRWATFNLGSFVNNNAFTLNITGTNIPAVGGANFYIVVKISGATTYWAAGNAAFSSGTFPGVGSDGIGAVSMGYSGSSNILRRIVFGTPTYSGAIIVRIGFTGNPTFTSLTATEIV